MFERDDMEKELGFQKMESMSTCMDAAQSMRSIPSMGSGTDTPHQQSIDTRFSHASSLRSNASSRSSARRGTWPPRKNDVAVPQNLTRHQKRYKSLTAKDDLATLISAQPAEPGSNTSRTAQCWCVDSEGPAKIANATSCKHLAASNTGTDVAGIFAMEAALKNLAKKARSLAKRDQAAGGRKMTQAQAGLTMANMFIGVGMLSLPFGFKQSGIALGLAIIVFSMIILTWTAFLVGSALTKAKTMLIAAGENPTELTLATLGHMAYGRIGRSCIVIALVGELWFCFLTSVILQAENLTLLLGLDPVRGTICSCFLSFICMLCPPKVLSMLSSISIVAVAVAAISLVISGSALAESKPHEFYSYHSYVRFGGAGTMLGLAMFSLSGHAQIGFIYTSMANPEKEFEGAVKMAMAMAGVFYMCIGIMGYYFYGDYVAQTLTSNLGYDLDGEPIEGLWWLSHLTAGCFIVKLQGTTPLIIAPVFELLYQPFMTAAEIEQGKARKRRGCIIAVVAIVSCLVSTLLHDSVAFATALTGDVFTIGTSVVFPAVVALRLSAEKQTFRDKLLLKGLAIAGVISAVGGLAHVLHGYCENDRNMEITEQLLSNHSLYHDHTVHH
eukprot:TRINITY_DN24658_c0_g1_i1.p1 TRINITY_DN24658_c0_g1~~TRINITY_DN24658_c0_g1_i1.p1  ORF type:complete len:613 (-),score=112.69 TRINITY_DN24658_c0_g1_i1:743-2581(-)